MVSDRGSGLVYDLRLSSVGPARMTGTDAVYEPSLLDLAMKLHYIKGVYFFSGEGVEDVTVKGIKEVMFWWLNAYYMTCGRFRRSNSGQLYIKCNDCGARFIEARCDKTVEEWLGMGDDSVQDLLIYHQPVGPDISFSPQVFFQWTKFKCGGFSMGFSWTHVLGDAFSASDFMNEWGHFMNGRKPINVMPKPPPTVTRSSTSTERPSDPTQLSKQTLSVKRVDSVGDLWVPANNAKMETFSLQLNEAQISHLQATASSGKPFESICAVIWQCVARVRRGDGSEPKTITICRKNPNNEKNILPRNSQIINSVEASFLVAEADVKELAMLLIDKSVDERSQIEELVEKDNWVSDFVLYGSNLTFVNLEDAGFYELGLNGHEPRFAYYKIQGVGDEGAVLVLPGAKGTAISNTGQGRLVSITLPENEVFGLKSELKRSGMLLENELVE